MYIGTPFLCAFMLVSFVFCKFALCKYTVRLGISKHKFFVCCHDSNQFYLLSFYVEHFT